MKKQKPLSRWVFRLIGAMLFVVFSTVLVASANGYLFNFETADFEQTALINLEVDPLPVTVSLNGEAKEYKKSSIHFSYLFPGDYTVEINKQNYFTWTKTFQVSPGEAVVNPFVHLFLSQASSVLATPAEAALLEQSALSTVQDEDLDVRGTEVWATQLSRTYPLPQDNNVFVLIGRYSHTVLGANWLPGKTHVLFQLGNEIHLMDRDGTNDNVIVTLSSSEPTLFQAIDKGKTLLYKDGDVVYRRPLQ